ncbi:MAG: T9SS type A sorting domain-containing protein [bacterium]
MSKKVWLLTAIVFLSTAIGIGGANAQVSQSQNRIEVLEFRTDYSRTFKNDSNEYITRIYPVSIHQAADRDIVAPAFADSVKRCYPKNEAFWSGNVRLKSNTYYKYGGDAVASSKPQQASGTWYQGWFKFDLSPLPDSIDSLKNVTINYYCYKAVNGPTTRITLLPGDPVPANAQTIWGWITTGKELTYAATQGSGWITRSLNDTGVKAVDSCRKTSGDWIAMGFHDPVEQPGETAFVYGAGSGQYTPYLELTYKLPDRTDISAEEVLEPVGTIGVNTIVTPTARWRNRQPHPDNYTAWFIFINPSGQRTTLPAIQVLGQRGLSDTTLYFTQFDVGTDTGRWTIKCSTYAAGDIDTTNDVIERFFRVVEGPIGNFDIQVKEIIAPAGVVDTNTSVVPQARYKNLSANEAYFYAYCALIDPDGIRVYTNSIIVEGLAGGRDTIIFFPDYNVGTKTGGWAVVCSTVAIGDTYPANDWLLGNFVVAKGGGVPAGWHEAKPLPLAPSGIGVKDGGWLTFDPNSGLIFAAKGNKVGDFYSYDPQTTTWRERALWKSGIEAKGPGKGGSGIADGRGHIYAVKGNNTAGFWCYHIEGDTWQQLIDVPLGATGKKVKGGSDLVYVELAGVPYVYLLKGYKNEFYRFNLLSNEWEPLPEAPLALSLKWDKGSWLAYDGNRYIYAHKAKYHEFWRFDIYTASWDTHRLKGLPFLSRTGKTKKAKDGSSGAYNDGFIYALKGGNTCEFYKYDPAGDSWTELAPIPEVGSTGKKKRVKGGGDLISYSPGLLFAIKGNKTREFWHYYAPVTDSPNLPNGILGATLSPANWRFWLSPNPCHCDNVTLQHNLENSPALTLTVCDITGAIRFTTRITSKSAQLNLSHLPTGVYLVRMDGDKISSTRKLVISR